MSAAGAVMTSHGIAGPDTPPGLASVRHLARHQVMGLGSLLLPVGAAAHNSVPLSNPRAARPTDIADPEHAPSTTATQGAAREQIIHSCAWLASDQQITPGV